MPSSSKDKGVGPSQRSGESSEQDQATSSSVHPSTNDTSAATPLSHFQDTIARTASSLAEHVNNMSLEATAASLALVQHEERSSLTRSNSSGQVKVRAETVSSVSVSTGSDQSTHRRSDEDVDNGRQISSVVASGNLAIQNHGGITNSSNYQSGNTTTITFRNITRNYYGPSSHSEEIQEVARYVDTPATRLAAAQQPVSPSDTGPHLSSRTAGPPTVMPPLSEVSLVSEGLPSDDLDGGNRDYTGSYSGSTSTRARASSLDPLQDTKDLPDLTVPHAKAYIHARFLYALSPGAIPLLEPTHPRPAGYPPNTQPTCANAGDIGMFNPEGGFTTLFNIRYSLERNVALGYRPPEGFAPCPSAERSSSVYTRRQGIYTDTSFEIRDPTGHPDKTSLKKSAHSGVILVLPSKRMERRFEPEAADLVYLALNAVEWYHHANNLYATQTRKNGSLLLVTKAHLADQWAIAAFSQKKKISPPLELVLKPVENPHPPFIWSDNSLAHLKCGPEIENHFQPHQQFEDGCCNQCVAVQVSAIRLQDKIWKASFGPTGSTSSLGSLKQAVKRKTSSLLSNSFARD